MHGQAVDGSSVQQKVRKTQTQGNDGNKEGWVLVDRLKQKNVRAVIGCKKERSCLAGVERFSEGEGIIGIFMLEI